MKFHQNFFESLIFTVQIFELDLLPCQPCHWIKLKNYKATTKCVLNSSFLNILRILILVHNWKLSRRMTSNSKVITTPHTHSGRSVFQSVHWGMFTRVYMDNLRKIHVHIQSFFKPGCFSKNCAVCTLCPTFYDTLQGTEDKEFSIHSITT